MIRCVFTVANPMICSIAAPDLPVKTKRFEVQTNGHMFSITADDITAFKAGLHIATSACVIFHQMNKVE